MVVPTGLLNLLGIKLISENRKRNRKRVYWLSYLSKLSCKNSIIPLLIDIFLSHFSLKFPISKSYYPYIHLNRWSGDFFPANQQGERCADLDFRLMSQYLCRGAG
jgi:hypothetical protein